MDDDHCRSGRPGRFHELADARAVSIGYSVAAAEMIERGTCHCGRYVARFVFERPGLSSSRSGLFPVTELAAVVDDLADEPLGPDHPSGLTHPGRHVVTRPAPTTDAPAREPAIDATRAGRLERLERADQRLAQLAALTDQQLAELPLPDPFEAGDIGWRVRGSDADRTLDEQARFLIAACPQLTLALNQDRPALTRDLPVHRLNHELEFGFFSTMVTEGVLVVGMAAVAAFTVLLGSYLTAPAAVLPASQHAWVPPTPRAAHPAATTVHTRAQPGDQSAPPQLGCAHVEYEPYAFASCGR